MYLNHLPPIDKRALSSECCASQALNGPEMLERLKPIFFSFRDHMLLLSEAVPQRLGRESGLMSSSAFGGEETEEQQACTIKLISR